MKNKRFWREKMRFEFNDDSQKICNSADVVNYGIQCDICGNKVLSVSNINGKRYCAECYQQIFEKDNQQTEIDQLKQQLDEKDKEIERLKNLFELNNEVVINQGKEIFDLRVQVLQQKQNQTQLAIQELEKVKMRTEWKFNSITDVVDYIDQQIKLLKGEKDVKD